MSNVILKSSSGMRREYCSRPVAVKEAARLFDLNDDQEYELSHNDSVVLGGLLKLTIASEWEFK